jgi:hypothetical protein
LDGLIEEVKYLISEKDEILKALQSLESLEFYQLKPELIFSSNVEELNFYAQELQSLRDEFKRLSDPKLILKADITGRWIKYT